MCHLLHLSRYPQLGGSPSELGLAVDQAGCMANHYEMITIASEYRVPEQHLLLCGVYPVSHALLCIYQRQLPSSAAQEDALL